MSKIITPKPRSVLTPDKQYEAYHKSAEFMRDTLFVGAIMGMAETVHQSREHIGLLDKESQQRAGIATSVGAANAIMDILNLAYENKWNVAVEMLNWKKNYIANKIKEKISGECPEGVPESKETSIMGTGGEDSPK